MKHEWKKHEKELYGAKKNPAQINVPAQKFITITGKGNPNNTDFANKVGALYALAYAIKMGYKKSNPTGEITDFTVYPLEGIWKQKEEEELIKENLEYKIMIRQPDFITDTMFEEALINVRVKKPNSLYDLISFETIEDGPCVEVLHVGSFDDEPASFAKMDSLLEDLGLERDPSWHREIYLNNANRVEKSKLKTILRYSIK